MPGKNRMRKSCTNQIASSFRSAAFLDITKNQVELFSDFIASLISLYKFSFRKWLLSNENKLLLILIFVSMSKKKAIKMKRCMCGRRRSCQIIVLGPSLHTVRFSGRKKMIDDWEKVKINMLFNVFDPENKCLFLVDQDL